jgi:hypothetical protein
MMLAHGFSIDMTVELSRGLDRFAGAKSDYGHYSVVGEIQGLDRIARFEQHRFTWKLDQSQVRHQCSHVLRREGGQEQIGGRGDLSKPLACR